MFFFSVFLVAGWLGCGTETNEGTVGWLVHSSDQQEQQMISARGGITTVRPHGVGCGLVPLHTPTVHLVPTQQ